MTRKQGHICGALCRDERPRVTKPAVGGRFFLDRAQDLVSPGRETRATFTLAVPVQEHTKAARCTSKRFECRRLPGQQQTNGATETNSERDLRAGLGLSMVLVVPTSSKRE